MDVDRHVHSQVIEEIAKLDEHRSLQGATREELQDLKARGAFASAQYRSPMLRNMITLSEDGTVWLRDDHLAVSAGDLASDNAAWPGYGHIARAQWLAMAAEYAPELADDADQALAAAREYWQRHLELLAQAVDAPRSAPARDVWFAYQTKNNDPDMHQRIYEHAQAMQALLASDDFMPEQVRAALQDAALKRAVQRSNAVAKLLAHTLDEEGIDAARRIWSHLEDEGFDVPVMDDDMWERAARWSRAYAHQPNRFGASHVADAFAWPAKITPERIDQVLVDRIGGSDDAMRRAWVITGQGIRDEYFVAKDLDQIEAYAQLMYDHPYAFDRFPAERPAQRAKRIANPVATNSSTITEYQIRATPDALLDFQTKHPTAELVILAKDLSNQGRHKQYSLALRVSGEVERALIAVTPHVNLTSSMIHNDIVEDMAPDVDSNIGVWLDKQITEIFGEDRREQLGCPSGTLPIMRSRDIKQPLLRVESPDELARAPLSQRSRREMIGSTACAHENAIWEADSTYHPTSVMLRCPRCRRERIRVVPFHQVDPAMRESMDVKSFDEQRYVDEERTLRILAGQPDIGNISYAELVKREGFVKLDWEPHPPADNEAIVAGAPQRVDFDIERTYDAAPVEPTQPVSEPSTASMILDL